jgi:transcriptional regulator of arginine metabolism
MTDVRTRRLRILADLLREGVYTSQEEVTAELNRRGYPVTQATVSRDLEAVGAVKVKRGGILSYALAEQMAAADWSAGRLERILAEWALSIEAAGALIVIRTPPGSAHLVASAIDHAQLPEIAGTVSGDDTMFVAVRDGVPVQAMTARFRRMMGREKEMYA